MHPSRIEAWVLQVADQVAQKQPIEDTRVELKANWTEPVKAARQIAGHANAAQGAEILWIIGLDEKVGLVGADYNNLANWMPQVQSQFNGLAPRVIDLNVPVGEKVVVALLFETDRAPFVVKNASYTLPGGGAVEWEVPWREGTRVRSATRSDLLRILIPHVDLPIFEILSGAVAVSKDTSVNPPGLTWLLKFSLYVEPLNQKIVIPFHKTLALIHAGGGLQPGPISGYKISPPDSRSPFQQRFQPSSFTIQSTEDEVIVTGPGKVILFGEFITDENTEPFKKIIKVDLLMYPVGSSVPVELEYELNSCSPEVGQLLSWEYISW